MDVCASEHVYCTMCLQEPAEVRRAMGPQEVELLQVVSHHVDAGN